MINKANSAQTRLGGKRPGAGRKPGYGRYGEGTTLVRVPNSQLVSVTKFLEAHEKRVAATRKAAARFVGQMALPLAEPPAQRIPLYGYSVSAGLPSSGDGCIQEWLDINQLLVSNPFATFFLRATGDSMDGDGIRDGDLIVVDRSTQPADGCIVVALVVGELMVRRLATRNEAAELHAANSEYAPIRFQERSELTIWGVVTGVVRQIAVP